MIDGKSWSRRQFMGQVGGAVAALGWASYKAKAENALEGAAGNNEEDAVLRCTPIISGNLRPFDAELDRAGWIRELDDEQALGFKLLWVSHVHHALGRREGEERFSALLDLCAERKVQVIVDMGSTPGWYHTLDAAKEKEVVGGYIRELAKRCRGHPAFFAWYLPHEIYMTWDAFRDYVDEVFPALTAMCREAVPGIPVTISPFFILDKDKVFGDFPYCEPDEYQAYWTRLLERSKLDIVMLQDSGEHFSYVTMAQRRPFFAAMANACRTSGSRLWGNVETAEFECPSIEEYVRRYGRMHSARVKDAPWRPVPIDRLEQKLRLAAEYAERLVAWGYYQYGRPHLGPDAAAWYEDYRQYYLRVMGKS